MADPGDGSSRAQPPSDPPLDFDPYRFGRPEHPVPPEYAPPGYVLPQAPPSTPGPPAPGPFPSGPFRSEQPDKYTPLPPYSAPPGQWTSPGPSGAPPGYPYPPTGYPYGPPAYGPPGQFGVAVRNGKATAALVLGIVSIILCWLTVVDVVPAVLAIVFGVLGRRRANQLPGRLGRNAATAGLVCGVVGAVLAAVVLTLLATKYSDCFGLQADQMRRCVETH